MFSIGLALLEPRGTNRSATTCYHSTMTPPADPKPRGPRIHLPPPLLVAVWFFAGYGADRLVPLRIPVPMVPVSRPLGWLLVLLGAGLAFWAMGLFRRARTTVLPFKAATTMVIAGPYRFSRNPIYLGMLVSYLGVALVTGLIWPLLLVPLVQSSLRGLAIDAEEAHLRERFGEQYREYQRRVRRWL